MLIRLAAFVMCLLAWASHSEAAEITLSPAPDGGATLVFITGDIQPGDAQAFTDTTAQTPHAMVFLASNGGALADGLAIGSAIRQAGYATVVADGDACYSACALIWAGGSQRYLAPMAVLGAHAAFRPTDSGTETSGIGNAQVGAYLARLGYSDAAIRFFTVAGPDSMMILTREIATIIDLQFEVYQGGQPAHATSAIPATGSQDIAATAQVLAAFSYLSMICAPYFQPDPTVLDVEINALLAGQPDASRWDGLLKAAVDEMARIEAVQGRMQNCLTVEGLLRKSGFLTGVMGPSFDCAAAQTRTELALCTQAELWALDRTMNAVYLYVRRVSDPVTRKNWLSAQRDWMKRRDACRDDKDCIITRYQERLEPLGDIRL